MDLQRLRVADARGEIEVRCGPKTSQAERPLGEPPAGTPFDTARYEVVTSDLVGRVRLARPPVAQGTLLDGDREIASIEALGIRNPVRSRGAGRVAVVYVEDGQAVDYGAPLFAIER